MTIQWDEIEQKALDTVAQHTKSHEAAALANTKKVLDAFAKYQVADYYLKPTTGYGYSDTGRDQLDLIYADIFKTEAALVRSQFVSGTHALAVALLGNLHPGDEMIGATGEPYDTMQTIIGYPVKTPGSLVDLGVTYKEIPMEGDCPDIPSLLAALTPQTRLVHVQRSCGYSSKRKTLTVAEIGEIFQAVKAVRPDIICFVDNCYGEFVERIEPTDVGADLIVGSLIKNPGGGLAPIGGYIAGKKEYVENAAYRLTSPGLGKEVGATLGVNQPFFQGFFLAPTVVAGALKGAVFAANIYERLGFGVVPNGTESRHDIIQAVTFGVPEGVIEFCKGIQAAAPVDSYVEPEPWAMPGYDSDVIMAAGAFVQGSSIELSADGPIKPPYAVYFQGGLTWYHAKLGILMSLQKLIDKKIAVLPIQEA